MEYNKKRRVIIVAALLTIGIIAVFTFFLISNSRRIERQNNEYLYDLTTQHAESIDSLIKENITFIRSAAYLYGNSLKSDKPDRDKLKEFEANTAFDDLWFVDIQGYYNVGGKNRIDLSGNEFYANGLHGGTGVTCFDSVKSGLENRIGFYAPVYYKNNVAGILLGMYDSNHIAGMLDYELFGEQGEALLCDSDGTVIGTSQELSYGNFLEYLKDTGAVTLEELSHISHLFNNSQGASFSYAADGDGDYLYAIVLSEGRDNSVRGSYPRK
jgi:hypothetical protein